MNPSTAAIDKHRLAGLQDGMYAIAMTLLVLELKLPPLGEHAVDAALRAALFGLWPKLLTWLLSFCVLAIFWLGDARALAAVVVADTAVLRLALVRLALVSLLPFSTAFMGEHGNRVPAAAWYAGHLLLLAATQAYRHHHLQRHPGLLAPEDAASAAGRGLQAWVIVGCAAAAFGLAFLVPAYNMFALVPVLFVHAVRRFKPRAGGGAA